MSLPAYVPVQVRLERNMHVLTNDTAFSVSPFAVVSYSSLVASTRYRQAAATLTRESGFSLEHPSITKFRSGVLAGKWDYVTRMLLDEEFVQGDAQAVGLASASNIRVSHDVADSRLR